MAQPEQACMNCHRGSAQHLIERTASLQQNTSSLLDNTEVALAALMDAIVNAGQEAVRLLSDAIDMARTGEDSVRQTMQTGTDTP